MQRIFVAIFHLFCLFLLLLYILYVEISLDDDYLDSNGRAAEMISGHGNGRDTDADAELHAGKYTDDERELQSNAKRIRGRGVQYYGGKGGAASQFTGNYPYAHDRPDPYHRSQFHDTNRNRAIRGSRGFGLGFPFNLFGFGAFSSLFL